MLRFVMSIDSNKQTIFLLLLLYYLGACTFQVGCRLIQLLMDTAYIQPPVDQIGDGPPDIRPAFVHNLKTITKDTQ